MNVLVSVLVTLVIIFIIPIAVYGLFAAFFGLQEPSKKLNFLMGVLVQKIGHAIGFAVIFNMGKGYFGTRWLLYSIVWVVMFVIVEIGQVITTEYSWKEAIAGSISEIVYFPLAASIIAKILT